MIWYLLYTLIFGTGGGELIIPKLDNYVKEYVVDEVRKDSIVDMIEISQDKRKEIVSENKDYVKELKSLYESRGATQDDFDKILNSILYNQRESQKANLKVVLESKKLITLDEWNNIQREIIKSLEESEEERSDRADKQQKQFEKLKKRISENIVDKNKREASLKLIEEVGITYQNDFNVIQDELANNRSALFKYDTSEKELKELQVKVITSSKAFFETTFKVHFKLVELTTVEEWNDIY